MPFVTLDKLAIEELRWLWKRRLPLGYLSMFDGDPGLGKSLVTLDLCARITTGRPFPDGAPTGAPRCVVLLNAEDGAASVIPARLKAAGADLSRVHIFDRAFDEPFLSLPGDVGRLKDAIADVDARYVVIDPVTAFLDPRVNLASDHHLRAALAPLAALAKRSDSVIQLVRHLNKSTSKDPLYRGLYSIGFSANCRVAWLTARDPCRARRYVLAQPKNNLDAAPPSLAYAIEEDGQGTARIVWHGASALDAAALLAGSPDRWKVRLRAQAFLLDFLKAGPRRVPEILSAARPLRLSLSTLNRARADLDIMTTRVHLGTPEQTSYWLLPGQFFG